MTSGRFQEVDIDLLADFVGGALDGTPEQAEVQRLIDTSPQWRNAYRALVRALDPVSDALALWGAEQPAMPEDVTARLTAALDTAMLDTAAPDTAAVDTAAPDTAAPDADADARDTARPVTVPAGRRALDDAGGGPMRPGRDRPAGPDSRPDSRPGSSPGSSSGSRPSGRPGGRSGAGEPFPAARRRRWVRLAGPAMVTAAIVAFAVVGLTWWMPLDGGQSDSASTAGGAAPGSAFREQATDGSSARVFGDAAPQQLRTSGIDYSPTTLVTIASDVARAAAASRESDNSGTPPGATPGDRAPTTAADPARPRSAGPTPVRAMSAGPAAPDSPMSAGAEATATVPAGLQRLADRTALGTCLATVTEEHGQGKLTIHLVDYASFRGRPALVVIFTDGTGARWAWVSGPECGLPGSAADTRHRTRVG